MQSRLCQGNIHYQKTLAHHNWKYSSWGAHLSWNWAHHYLESSQHCPFHPTCQEWRGWDRSLYGQQYSQWLGRKVQGKSKHHEWKVSCYCGAWMSLSIFISLVLLFSARSCWCSHMVILISATLLLLLSWRLLERLWNSAISAKPYWHSRLCNLAVCAILSLVLPHILDYLTRQFAWHCRWHSLAF